MPGDFDFDSDSDGKPEKRPERPELDRPARDRRQPTPLTAGKLALIIWGPIAAIAVLGVICWCLWAGVVLFVNKTRPTEPDPVFNGRPSESPQDRR